MLWLGWGLAPRPRALGWGFFPPLWQRIGARRKDNMNNSHLTARPAFCAASTVLGRAWPLPTQKPERRVRCPELGTGDAVTLREDSCHPLVLQTRGGGSHLNASLTEPRFALPLLLLRVSGISGAPVFACPLPSPCLASGSSPQQRASSFERTQVEKGKQRLKSGYRGGDPPFSSSQQEAPPSWFVALCCHLAAPDLKTPYPGERPYFFHALKFIHRAHSFFIHRFS